MGWNFQEITISAGEDDGEDDLGQVNQEDAEPTPTIWTPTGLARPDSFDEDYIFIDGQWQEVAGQLVSAGGGRYNQQLVIVGQNKIFFEEYV